MWGFAPLFGLVCWVSNHSLIFLVMSLSFIEGISVMKSTSDSSLPIFFSSINPSFVSLVFLLRDPISISDGGFYTCPGVLWPLHWDLVFFKIFRDKQFFLLFLFYYFIIGSKLFSSISIPFHVSIAALMLTNEFSSSVDFTLLCLFSPSLMIKCEFPGKFFVKC